MLCGYTPFWDGGSPMKIYENILRGRVKYPAYIHPDAQDLLQQLITPDLTKRLGKQYNLRTLCTFTPSLPPENSRNVFRRRKKKKTPLFDASLQC